jgi:hypothetical protein
VPGLSGVFLASSPPQLFAFTLGFGIVNRLAGLSLFGHLVLSELS